MILYTCGCSFTYGEELENKQNAWPYKLGEKLHAIEVINTATSSASNEYIQRNIIEFILANHKKKDSLFVVIGWTSDIRWEGYIDNPIPTYTQMKLNKYVKYTHPKEFKIYSKKEIDELLPQFIQKEYTKISNDFLLCFKSNKYFNFYNKLKQVLLTHCFLDMLDIKHVFFNSLIETYNRYEYNKTSETINFLKNIKMIKNEFQKDLYYIETPTMEDYTKTYPIAPLEHPLEDGHNAWAEYLYQYIIENNMI